MRTSPVHYIAPSAISITPNANGLADDLAVFIARGAKIKVFSGVERLGVNPNTNSFREWTLSGRNRRLNGGSGPYTIYARLDKSEVYVNGGNAYLVFAAQSQYGEDNPYGLAGEWYDKHSYVMQDGLAPQYDERGFPKVVDDPDYWWVKLGTVSAIDGNGQRTVNLDTGILGTEQWNTQWELNPDELPLRIALECTIGGNAVGMAPYVLWGQQLDVKASLVEGWEKDAADKVRKWTITRDSGNAQADEAWNHPVADTGEETAEESEEETTPTERMMTDGQITLAHTLGDSDDFAATVAATFTITAWGEKKAEEEEEGSDEGQATEDQETQEDPEAQDSPEASDTPEEPELVPLTTAVITVYAETVAIYELELSTGAVTYNPVTQTYSPANGVAVRIRAKAQDGSLFYPNNTYITTAQLRVLYWPVDEQQDEESQIPELTLTDGRGLLPVSAFAAGKSINLWLENGAQAVLARATVAYIRFGEKGDTPISIYRWYKEGLTPQKPTDTNSDEPAPASGDATGEADVYPTDKWSRTVPDRPATGDWVLWKCYSIRHGSGIIDPWQGPIQESGVNGSPGEDARDREYIYIRTNAYPFDGTLPADINTPDSTSTGQTPADDDFVPAGWSDTALPVTENERYVYESMRLKPAGVNQQWGAFSVPVLRSHWGVNGMDGDGVQYVYKLFDHELDDSERISNIPAKPEAQNANGEWIPTGWSDEPQAPTKDMPFCYCSIIKKINGTWGSFEKLGLWSNYSKSITKQSEVKTYQVSADGVTAPTGTWHAAKQDAINAYNQANGISGTAWAQGTWMWTRIVITWSDTSHTTLYQTERNAADGVAGQDIISGETVITYCVSDNNTAPPEDSSFKPYNQITIIKGKWLWSKSTTPYYKGSVAQDNYLNSSSNYSVTYIATDGINGASVSIDGVNTFVRYAKDNTRPALDKDNTSVWKTTVESLGLSAGDTYWTWLHTAYTDGNSTDVCNPSYYGADGRDGAQWTIGQDGYWYKDGVKQSTKAEGKDGTGIQIKGSVATVNALPGTGNTQGDCWVVESDSHLYTWTGSAWRDLGAFKGESGRDGTSSYMHIAYADEVTLDAQGVATSCTGFTTVKQKDAYAWTGLCTNESPADPTVYTAYEWNKVRGADGENGTGSRIMTTPVKYAKGSADGSQPTEAYANSKWKDSIAATNPAVGDYIWSLYGTTTYTIDKDGTETATGTVWTYGVNRIGSDGDNGYSLHTAYADTAPNAPSGTGVTGFSTTMRATSKYIGICVRKQTSATGQDADPTDPTVYEWAKFEGPQGQDGTSVSIDGGNTFVRYAKANTRPALDKDNTSVWKTTVESLGLSAGDTYWTWLHTSYTDGNSTDVCNPSYYGADGRDGLTHTISISADGYWVIDGVKQSTKAEGKDGTGIQIKGSVATVNALPGTGNTQGDCWVVESDSHLYTWTGSAWRDLGAFKGESGRDGTSSYMHIAYADEVTLDAQGVATSCTGFTTVKQKDAYAWTGLCTNESPADPTVYTAYEWNKVRGADGENGTGSRIMTTPVKYAKGSADGSQPTEAYANSKWKDSIAATNPAVGDYIWSLYGTTTYTIDKDGNETATGTVWTYGFNRIGSDGDNGYSLHTAYADTAPNAPSGTGVTGFSTTMRATSKYIGICVRKQTSATGQDADPTDPTVYEWAKFEGPQGPEGRAITGMSEHYLASPSDTGITKPVADGVTDASKEWTTNPNVPNAQGVSQWGETNPYLWNYEKVTYSSGTTPMRTTPRVIAIWTKDGTNGRGIDSIVNWYAISNDGVTTPPFNQSGAQGWDDDPIAPNADYPYLWNYEEIIWTDGTQTMGYDKARVIGHFGSDGRDGTDGQNSVRLALDNEHEDFLYDGATLVAPANGASSPIRLYDGGTDITDSMPTPVIHSVNGTSNNNSGAYISNKTLYVKSLTAATAEVVVKCTYNGSTYYAKFTANRTNQDKYDIVCKPGSIAYNRTEHASDASSAAIQTIQLAATGIGLGGTNLPVTLSTAKGAGKLCVFWAYVSSDGTIGTLSSNAVTEKTVNKSECETYAGIYFELRYYTSSSAYRVCDHETVEIAKVQDGESGQDGKSAAKAVFSPSVIFVDAEYNGNSVGLQTFDITCHVDVNGTNAGFEDPLTVKSKPAGVSASYNSSTGRVTISIAANTAAASYEGEVVISMDANLNDADYSVSGSVQIVSKRRGQSIEGKDGNDGYGLTLTPASLILESEVSGSQELVKYVNNVVTVRVMKGSTPVQLTCSVLTTAGSYSSNITPSQSNIPVNNAGTYSTVTLAGGINLNNSESGFFTVRVSTSDGNFSQDVRINFYVNRATTFARQIKNGIETAMGAQTEYGYDQIGDVIKTAYQADIQTSAQGLTQQFTEQVSRVSADSRNLFGFHKGVILECAIPFIQGYGVVAKPWESSDKTARLYNLGMYGRLGYYTVSCMVRTSASAGYVRMQMNWHTAVGGTQAVSGGAKGTAYATAGGWTQLVGTFLFNEPTEDHIGTSLQEGEAGSFANDDINGYVDIGQIVSGTDTTKKTVSNNYIYVRHLKVEYKDFASDFCESDEDIAYLGQRNIVATPDGFTPSGPAVSRTYYSIDTYGGVTVKDVYGVVYNNGNSAYGDHWGQFLTYPVSIRQLKAGQIYTLSFWARATQAGFVLRSVMRLSTSSSVPYNNNGAIVSPSVENIYAGSNGEVVEGISTNGMTSVRLTTSWKQYFIRYYVADPAYLYELVGATIYGSDNLGKNCSLYVGDVQFQEGYVMQASYFSSLIEQNARRISLVQQSGTRMAGFDIQNGVINLFGDRVTFSNADGSVRDKVGIDPETGMIVATGGIRSPFVFNESRSEFDLGASNNLAVYSEGGDRLNPSTTYTLPWDVTQSGRRVTITNWKWKNYSGSTSGFAACTAPEGKYFFEDGARKSMILMSREAIELLGFGDDTEFYGWIVTGRIDLMTEMDYGHPLSVFVQGTVAGGTSPQFRGYTCFGGAPTVTRISQGRYKLSSFGGLNIIREYVIVMVSGKGTVDNLPVAASWVSSDESGVEIQTFTTQGLVDGSFSILMTNSYSFSSLAPKS